MVSDDPIAYPLEPSPVRLKTAGRTPNAYREMMRKTPKHDRNARSKNPLAVVAPHL